MALLKEGDIIEIREGDTVYTNVPKHFVYDNRKGDWSLTKSNINIDHQFLYLAGSYVVTKQVEDGGGTAHGPHDVYPAGHHVYCKSLDHETEIELDFYQTGSFTAMIPDRVVIGHAELIWKEVDNDQ